MADTKISALTSATLPLSGSELVPIVQSGTTVKTAISNIASNQPPTPYTANGVVYASSTSALATGSGITYNGTTLTTANDASISGLTVGKGGGAANTVFGVNALAALGNSGDVAVGNNAGAAKTTTSDTAQSTFVGYYAGATVSTGVDNTFIGGVAGRNTTTGGNNVVLGGYSFFTNTTGSYNVAIGKDSLRLSTTASNNTAVGYQAGYSNQTGLYNTFVGYQAGYNSIGSSGTGSNSCFGILSGNQLTSGTINTFLGQSSGYYVTTGSKNTILGSYSGNQGGLDIRTASNYIVLSDGDGNPRGVFDSNGVLRLGDVSNSPAYTTTKLSIYRTGSTFRLVDFYNTNNASGDENVRIQLGSNANNTSSYQLIATTGGTDKYYLYGNGTYATVSDQRLKKNIEDAKDGFLEDVAKLRVVKYNWTNDAENTPKELGWIAQEVEQVFPRLVQDCLPNENGDVYKTVKSSVLPYILLKAIQELKAEFDAYKATHP